MSESKTPNDLVLSYVVTDQGVRSQSGASSHMIQNSQIEGALKEGYRVIDIISTPIPGGQSTTGGGVAVTVLLSHPKAGSYYKPAPKQP